MVILCFKHWVMEDTAWTEHKSDFRTDGDKKTLMRRNKVSQTFSLLSWGRLQTIRVSGTWVAER